MIEEHIGLTFDGKVQRCVQEIHFCIDDYGPPIYPTRPVRRRYRFVRVSRIMARLALAARDVGLDRSNANICRTCRAPYTSVTHDPCKLRTGKSASAIRKARGRKRT